VNQVGYSSPAAHEACESHVCSAKLSSRKAKPCSPLSADTRCSSNSRAGFVHAQSSAKQSPDRARSPQIDNSDTASSGRAEAFSVCVGDATAIGFLR
jgi:hypothetical protein